jgi:hypothetical protein
VGPGGGRGGGGRGCFNCGEDGHMARDCPNQGSPNQSSIQGACYRCGQAGHKMFDCPMTKSIPPRHRRRIGAASLAGHAAVRAMTHAEYLNTPESMIIANQARDSNQTVIKWTKIAESAAEGSASQKLADKNCSIARIKTFDSADEVQEMVIAKEQRTFSWFAGTCILSTLIFVAPF